MKHILLLAALCAALAGCAGNAPAPQPAVPPPPPPPPPPVAELPRPLPPQTPQFQTVPEPRTMPAPLLSPDQRQRDQAFVVDAINKALAPARGNPGRMHVLLGFSTREDNSAAQYLADDMVHAMDDPRFVEQLVANMSDAELVQARQHPSLAMEMANGAVGHALENGFLGLAGGEQKAFMQDLGLALSSATPEECQQFNQKGTATAANALFRMASHLPPQSQQQFAAVLVLSMAQPHRGMQPPPTAEEQRLVGLNLRRYVNSLPAADHDRMLAYFRDKNPADECWAVGHIFQALTSGDDALVQIGVRLFGYGMSRGSGAANGVR